MTSADIHTWIHDALTLYQTGGASWLVQSGVVFASSYDDVVEFKGQGKRVYGWVGEMRVRDELNSATTIDQDVVVWLCGRVSESLATLEATALNMRDDLVRALLIGGGATSAVRGNVELVVAHEIPLKKDATFADVFIQGRVRYIRRVS